MIFERDFEWHLSDICVPSCPREPLCLSQLLDLCFPEIIAIDFIGIVWIKPQSAISRKCKLF